MTRRARNPAASAWRWSLIRPLGPCPWSSSDSPASISSSGTPRLSVSVWRTSRRRGGRGLDLGEHPCLCRGVQLARHRGLTTAWKIFLPPIFLPANRAAWKASTHPQARWIRCRAAKSVLSSMPILRSGINRRAVVGVCASSADRPSPRRSCVRRASASDRTSHGSPRTHPPQTHGSPAPARR